MKNVSKVWLGLILVFIPFLILFSFELFDNNRTETVFAIIGDYGDNSVHEKQVSDLVHSWNPQFIITTGDNGYHQRQGEFLDRDIGQYYSDFIGNYKGVYGKGSEQNRMYPSIGNHDWNDKAEGLPVFYLNYFSVLNEYNSTSGNMLYYDFEEGPIHFFALDSDERQPDGIDKNSVQAQWLRQQMEKSSSDFNIVYFHVPPFSNTIFNSSTMDWPFQEWGADIVISGHAHTYERFDKNGFPYVVNGLGGHSMIHCLADEDQQTIPNYSEAIDGVVQCSVTPPTTMDPDTVIGYNLNWGAMLVKSTDNILNFTFIDVDHTKIDSFLVYSKNNQ